MEAEKTLLSLLVASLRGEEGARGALADFLKEHGFEAEGQKALKLFDVPGLLHEKLSSERSDYVWTDEDNMTTNDLESIAYSDGYLQAIESLLNHLGEPFLSFEQDLKERRAKQAEWEWRDWENEEGLVIKETGTWQSEGNRWTLPVYVEGSVSSTRYNFIVNFYPYLDEVDGAFLDD